MTARREFATPDLSAFGNLQHHLEATNSALPTSWLIYNHDTTYELPQDYNVQLFLNRYAGLVAANTRLYRTCNGPHRTFPLIEWSVHHAGLFFKIREFHRWLAYHEANVPYWDNELRLLVPYYRNYEPNARLYAASRISWIHQRLRYGEDPYAVDGRYIINTTLVNVLQGSLEDRHKHLLQLSYIPPLELHMLMMLIYQTEAKLQIVEVMLYYVRSMARVKTEQVHDIALTYEQDGTGYGDDHTCDICFYPYVPPGGSTSSDPEEVPVRIVHCNHVFGRDCLQRWINDHATCPMCGMRLLHKSWDLGLEDENITKVRDLRLKLEELDPEIDRYLMEVPKDAYGDGLKQLIQRIGDEVYWPMKPLMNSFEALYYQILFP